MFKGYSVLLGEYIDADNLSYEDCKPFQMICPCCKEPVFKVSKAGKSQSLEYLSHYNKDTSFEVDCKLRVDSISNAEHFEHNSLSRNQKLSHFLSVFIGALSGDPYMSYGKGLVKTHKIIDKSKAWQHFRDMCYVSSKKGGMALESLFQESADFYLKETEDIGGVPKTGFSMGTQARIANDMMTLLMSNKGRPNYNALYNHSVLHLLKRYENPANGLGDDGLEVMENVCYFINKLISSGKKEGMAIILQMRNTPIYPPFVEAPTSYLTKLASEISHEMIGTLLRLPYFKILSEMQGKQ